jgi:hypothetical protein
MNECITINQGLGFWGLQLSDSEAVLGHWHVFGGYGSCSTNTARGQ